MPASMSNQQLVEIYSYAWGTRAVPMVVFFWTVHKSGLACSPDHILGSRID